MPTIRVKSENLVPEEVSALDDSTERSRKRILREPDDQAEGSEPGAADKFETFNLTPAFNETPAS